MDSLLLSCRALSSPTTCRFIPALSVYAASLPETVYFRPLYTGPARHSSLTSVEALRDVLANAFGFRRGEEQASLMNTLPFKLRPWDMHDAAPRVAVCSKKQVTDFVRHEMS